MKKHVCIIGLGQFGAQLARTLADDCEVLALDVDDEVVNAISKEVHGSAIVDVRNYANLEAVVSSDFDEAIICLSEDLETSILCALHLQKLGVKFIRAKAGSRDHAAILQAIGVQDVFFPEKEAAIRKAHHILHPELVDILTISGSYRVVELPLPEAYVGKTLAELDLRKLHHVSVIAVRRPDGEALEILPAPDVPFKAGVNLVVLGRAKDLDTLTL